MYTDIPTDTKAKQANKRHNVNEAQTERKKTTVAAIDTISITITV